MSPNIISNYHALHLCHKDVVRAMRMRKVYFCTESSLDLSRTKRSSDGLHRDDVHGLAKLQISKSDWDSTELYTDFVNALQTQLGKPDV
ncbi:hypothetical protein TSAR_002164 [Trichomalopsis sarcophagae]|uniref:Uncharacterized protein n=1 Tax=Trichomalopsis sarcophagae TaxID=543379 RepID=A0A232EMA2_9HYME|nr:hypothetical protein TSAR_002164 [Trichomalopsis sarcophagae]